jgi:RNA polymerase-binding transcription factor DksA
MIQALMATGQSLSNRGDVADQAARALEVDTQIRVAAILSADQAGGATKQKRDSEGRVICRECEVPISEVRLRALPKATLCRDCKEQDEAHSPKFGRIGFGTLRS